jgi:calcium permeable stress-gated cation channel
MICGIWDLKIRFSNRIKKAETAIEDWRSKIDLKKAENYGFASMAAVPYAHIVAKTLAGKTKQGAIIGLAPNPKDIVSIRSHFSTNSFMLI